MSNRSLPYYIVDVFAEDKYKGNQLAVFRHAASLSPEEMQQIAQEVNFSETTFMMSDTPVNGGYDVRIFTPKEELPFAGHPTLGTAFIIQKEILNQPADQIVLNLGVGQIPVTFETSMPAMGWMQQKQPAFGHTLEPDTAAAMLGIPVSSIDTRFPIQNVSTGMPSLIVPLTELNAVKGCKLNRELYMTAAEQLDAKAVLVFCPETYHSGNHLNVRVFVDILGIPEDPATGSANGNLAGYLVKHRYFGRDDIDIRVEQGYEINRPSLLYLRAQQNDDGIRIQVGGTTIYIAKGEWG